jgi:serine protease inhibitor
MQYTKLFLLLCLLIALMISIQPTGTADGISASTTRITQANTRFAFKLLAQLRQNSASANFLFSPSSIGWCLGMALNGAEGNTREEISSVLEIRGINLNDFNHGYEEWGKSWTAIDPKVELEIANSIWAKKGLSLKPEFVGVGKDFFSAQVSELNFNDPRSVGIINAWVQKQTRNKIDGIVDQISPDSVLFLINAIYFNGKWTKAFDAAKTKDEPFSLGNGSQKQVPMMRQRGTFQYLENNEFQAIRLPYGNRRLTMDVFLPSEKLSLSAFLNLAKSENWDQWNSQFSESDGEIVLPRFRVEYETSLNAALKSLGMKMAFDPDKADFSGMVQNGPRTYISSVKHKAFAEVNEEGTEAAAVTSTEVRAVSMPVPTKSFQMIVNRPFFFVIEDSATHSLLFVGWIVAPV